MAGCHLEDSTSRYPPDGYILYFTMISLLMTTLGVVILRGYIGILIKRFQWKSSSIAPEPKPPDPEPPDSSNKNPVNQVVTSVYSCEDIKSLENKLYFDADAETCIIDNAANRHIWNNKKDFQSIRPISSSTLVATVGETDHKPTDIGNASIFN